LKEIKTVSAPRGIAWLGLGCQPVSIAEDIEWVPKARYKIMRETLPGALTHRMMKETAAIQISIDYVSERDAMEKLRLAFGLSPVLSAMFGNSPFLSGRASGILSRRARIWLHTSPDRSGILEEVFSKNFDFAAYVEWALDIPMIFIVRGGRWVPLRISFRQFMREGFENYSATMTDWELHLTTLFTEVRLKTYIEIRGIDCQKASLGPAIPALIKGIFYDDEARASAWAMVEGAGAEERQEILHRLPSTGLRTPFKGGILLGPARKLVALAEKSLNKAGKSEEAAYLEPLKELMAAGKSPAERLLDTVGVIDDEKTRIRAIIDASEI
jgi:glutamate--cysteine ligase